MVTRGGEESISIVKLHFSVLFSIILSAAVRGDGGQGWLYRQHPFKLTDCFCGTLDVLLPFGPYDNIGTKTATQRMMTVRWTRQQQHGGQIPNVKTTALRTSTV